MTDAHGLHEAHLLRLLHTVNGKVHSSSAGRTAEREVVVSVSDETVPEGAEMENDLQGLSFSSWHWIPQSPSCQHCSQDQK